MKSKTTNESTYQAGGITTEDLEELDCIQKFVEVATAEPENKHSCGAENGNVELNTFESRLTEEDMDGDEKKAQVYSPNRKPQNGESNVVLDTKYMSRKYSDYFLSTSSSYKTMIIILTYFKAINSYQLT